MKSLPSHYQLLLSVMMLSATSQGLAAEIVGKTACRAIADSVPERPISARKQQAAADSQELFLSARQAKLDNADDEQDKKGQILGSQYRFSGEVLLERGTQTLSADTLNYNNDTGKVTAEGAVTLWDTGLVARSTTAALENENEATAIDAEYWLTKRKGRGQAEKIQRQGSQIVTLEKSYYTSCPPENETWRLESQHTILDLEAEQGLAEDVVFRFKGVPLFYTPYLSFPISDKRKSGLLVPKIGQSTNRGVELSQPYYWNIAPNLDATLTPRFMSKRGILLATEFRYLFKHSQGQIDWEYLPDDKDSTQSRVRQQLRWKNFGRYRRFYSDINYNAASDNNYFEDFGNSLDASSTTHLEKRLDLGYIGVGYQALFRLQKYQTLSLDPAARPYERLPQLLFQTTLAERNLSFNPNFSAEYVRFNRNNDIIASPTGQRFNVKTALSYPWRDSRHFIVPKVSLNYTRYSLDNTALSTTQDDQIIRTIPSFSTDAGLFFERPVRLFERAWVQTLEPRAYYQYTAFEDQSAIPVFDTAEYDFTFAQLFRENRYSGVDRISDENRLALALTSRFLDQNTGIEYFRASIGQAYHFNDRRVHLPNQADSTESTSDMITEVAMQVTPSIQLSQTLQWNAETDNVNKSLTRLRYRGEDQRLLNLSYRLRKENNGHLEQTDVSWYWPLSPRWRSIGRWNYSLEHNRNLETFIGFEYRSCCWAARMVGRHYLQNIDGDYANGVFLQIEFNGLGGAGRRTADFLQESIAGFNDTLPQ